MCLKRCLDDFTGHNIDTACELVVAAGAFMMRQAETHERMESMLGVCASLLSLCSSGHAAGPMNRMCGCRSSVAALACMVLHQLAAPLPHSDSIHALRLVTCVELSRVHMLSAACVDYARVSSSLLIVKDIQAS